MTEFKSCIAGKFPAYMHLEGPPKDEVRPSANTCSFFGPLSACEAARGKPFSCSLWVMRAESRHVYSQTASYHARSVNVGDPLLFSCRLQWICLELHLTDIYLGREYPWTETFPSTQWMHLGDQARVPCTVLRQTWFD